MGICLSKNNVYPSTPEEKNTNNTINKQIQEEAKLKEKNDNCTFKVLLLGPADSGKSTFLKQLRIINNMPLDEEDIGNAKFVCISNLLSSMKLICQNLESLSININPDNKQYIDIVIGKTDNVISEYKDKKDIPHDLIEACKKLWENENAIKECIKLGNKINLLDSAEYFFDKMNYFFNPSYIPTNEDILHQRVPTQRISETTIPIVDSTNKLRVFDFGGSRSQRLKWATFFDNVDLVIYIFAISSYDQNLQEDPKVNRLKDAEQLFKQLSRNKILWQKNIVIFFNKIDIFKKKLNTSPVSNYYPEYTGGNDYAEAATFFAKKFVKLNANKNRIVSTHLTWATDTKHCSTIIKLTIQSLQQYALSSAGLT
ncbi:guanine nucleotide binding protein, alpha subunit [Anaeromyces robustus]|uniref:Guanine nucleotide binding protein, alpha subunit n=1 Tax=Anaeromyces robustus TaxID=1754192 RepID=A0A1Y1XE99_9FUNG|nr:guanine nucleotide binding protein, alpha subunit [Anaeromyces robustus]|eukprot:ORX84080.1 guanine nucleotide binding protein, alpha subunit [Anaeromyces robustus]